ncbi:MAG: flavodoxin [Eubacteriales bacterium]
MRRMIAVFICLLLAFGFSGCGGQRSTSAAQGVQRGDESITPESALSPAEEGGAQDIKLTAPEAREGRTLVVFYSATGNTEEVAGFIAAATGGDTVELVPVEKYSSADLNWRDKNSRVSREHDDPDERTVELAATAVPDWESYDTVFIGYPIWWGIAAWPVDGFIAANDFTGKTVIPFCTSSSSDLGESGELLAKAAGSGTWLEGQRFRSGVSEEAVKTWVAELGL